jgi:hypothetical protein
MIAVHNSCSKGQGLKPVFLDVLLSRLKPRPTICTCEIPSVMSTRHSVHRERLLRTERIKAFVFSCEPLP